MSETANLHARIAKDLGWTIQEAQGFSLPALRELVRSQKLKAEISQVLARGTHITRRSHD